MQVYLAFTRGGATPILLSTEESIRQDKARQDKTTQKARSSKDTRPVEASHGHKEKDPQVRLDGRVDSRTTPPTPESNKPPLEIAATEGSW